MKWARLWCCCIAVLVLPLTLLAQDTAQSPQVGAYYFPGWKAHTGDWWDPPWEKIRPFPEREPLLGYYDEGSRQVAATHIRWMKEYGLDFFIFDWYTDSTGHPRLTHALDAFLDVKDDSARFCILWCNHWDTPLTVAQFDSMCDVWITQYFTSKRYVTVEGEPVVFVVSPYNFRNIAKRYGVSPAELLNTARERARRKGLKGIHFVACVESSSYWALDFAPSAGFDAVTAYNYHRFLGGKDQAPPSLQLPSNYAELTAVYAKNWEWFKKKSHLQFYVPATAGWSRKPWGSSTPHDNCVSDPFEFERHLREAKATAGESPVSPFVLICAWNEYGEGSFIEPTRQWGFSYLQAVRRVFH